MELPLMSATSAATELTKRIVRMNTINPPGNEEACAQVLGALLEEAGFTARYYSLGTGRASLVARVGRADGPRLCMTGHLDTVPLGAAAWHTPELAGEVDGNRLLGRGTSDMKAGVAAMVVAATRLAQAVGRSPAGLELVLTAGEETGCDGARDLVHRPGALGRVGAVLVAEPTANYPIIGHKGALWLKAMCRGVTAHGSMPERGVNAVYKLARAITKLEKFCVDTPPHPLMGQTTLNVGTVHGGLNINSVPDAAEMRIDIRTVPGRDHAAIIEQLRLLLGSDVEFNTLVDCPAICTSPEDEWVQSIYEIVTPFLPAPAEARTATYFTDAAVLSPAYGNVPTVILGPGEPAMAHKTDEYCEIERLETSVPIYEGIIRRWCDI
jgi:succinyl-diaminopimelate desuccinylase